MKEKSKLIIRPNGLLLHRKKQDQEGSWREDETYKILFSMGGSLFYQTKMGDVALLPEQFMIINPQIAHKQLGFEQEKFLVELSHRFVHEVAHSLRVKPLEDIYFGLHLQKHPQVSQWVRFTHDFIEYQQEDDPMTELFVDNALTQLCLLILKYGVNSHSKDLSTSYLQTYSPLLFPAIQALKEEYTEAWTLDRMADISGMNKYQFSHLFKETTGVSPYSWLQLYRLVRSQELLLHSNQNILDIATCCGFSSVTVYNQLFKRIYGISPTAFRKRYK